MAAGDLLPAEDSVRTDPRTGTRIRQLTDHLTHSHHLYFTNSGWYDGGRRLLFASDRGNAGNLYSVGVESGEIRQLTDLDRRPRHTTFLDASLDADRGRVYFWHGNDLTALDLGTLETRTLYTAPDGFEPNMTNVTADGAFVCTVLYEDMTERLGLDLLHGYVGFEEFWAAKPLSRVLRVDTATGATDVVAEKQTWIGHVNTSPTRPNLLTYCHEGPWYLVDNRIWGLDLDTGRTWPVRPTAEGEQVGHEYWFADGERIGYHGRRPDGSTFFGSARFDDTDHREADCRRHSMHFHSNDAALIVGDGSAREPHLLLWALDGDSYSGPRVLLDHRCSFHVQEVHVHPRLSPDGRSVVYTSDASGYGNVHLAQIPDTETLPLLTE